jgi:hypothetical protein
MTQILALIRIRIVVSGTQRCWETWVSKYIHTRKQKKKKNEMTGGRDSSRADDT